MFIIIFILHSRFLLIFGPFFSTTLYDEGYKVLEAESGRETFYILNSESIDLVILDIKLRLESGLDVLQRITKEFPRIPVILCSAYASFQDDYVTWLAKSYIVKSCEPEELLKEVYMILNK